MNITCNAYGTSVGKETPNRDAFFCNPLKGFFGVFDGVGNLHNTEKASREAARIFSNAAQQLGSLERDDRYVKPWLCELMATAHGQIKFTYSVGPHKAETTATVMVVCADKDEPNIAVVNVGDSRLYGFNRKNQTVSRLTRDDSVVQQYPHFDDVEHENELSPAELIIFTHMRRVISNAIGGPSYTAVEAHSYPIEGYDGFLLTTDGVHDNLTTKEIGRIVFSSGSEEETVKTLIESARNRSERLDHLRSKPDDITAVYVTIGLEK